jgi:hypothetical protein
MARQRRRSANAAALVGGCDEDALLLPPTHMIPEGVLKSAKSQSLVIDP